MSWREHLQLLATIAFAILAVAAVVYGAIAIDDYLRHQRRMECIATDRSVSECVLMERCK